MSSRQPAAHHPDQPVSQIEPEPTAAIEIAGSRVEVLREFARELGTRGEPLGLIGPLEAPRIWTRHLLNSALLAPYITAGGRVADIGTGGGMPGLVLAIVCPDTRFELIEAMERRAAWLREQITHLGLENARVRHGRAEDFHGTIEVDQVTARAVKPLRGLVPLAAPLIRDGGELLLLKGASVRQEIDAAERVLRTYRVSALTVELLGTGLLAETTQLVHAVVRPAQHS